MSLDTLPLEIQVEIASLLPLESFGSVIRVNCQLEVLVDIRPLRLRVLRSHYRMHPQPFLVFGRLLLIANHEYHKEQIETLLDFHPEWVNAKVTIRNLRQNSIFQECTFRPLEANPKLWQLLLERGADPLLSSCTNFTMDSVPISTYQVLESEESSQKEESSDSILTSSLNYGDPTLHYLLLQRGYHVPWEQIPWNIWNTAHLDLLMTYVQLYPCEWKTIEKVLPKHRSSLYFPLRTLIEHCPSRPSELTVFEDTLDYRPTYRFLASLKGKVQNDDNKLSLQITVNDTPYCIQLDYYQGLGLILGLKLLRNDYTVDKAQIMELEQTEPEYFILPSYEYRLNPSIQVHPLLYSFPSNPPCVVQCENEEVIEGLGLALSLHRGDLQTM